MIGQRALPALLRQRFSGFSGSANSSSIFIQVFRYLSTAVAVLLLCSTAVRAATISYGNFGPVPPGISFLDVVESSGTDAVPLYGPPTPFSVGLDFDPKNFVATTAGGGADITDGQLNFTVMGAANPNGSGVGIDFISLFESGDYTLAGTGTAATQALAGAIMSARITQVDGLPVPPINIPPVNASVGINLAANPGVVQPWGLGVTVNVAGQVPVGAKIGATKVEVVVNNQLLAFSQLESAAFIAKKDFRIVIIPRPGGEIPEPSTLVLVGVAVALTGCVAKQRCRMAA